MEPDTKRILLSGNEAVALAACNARAALGAGYPGTPSTEILETLSKLGVKAEWAPNEKTALEVAIGAAFAGARAIATMKHVGLNVAADPLFTAAYTGVRGGLAVVTADDPGMASSQNEQDNRHYARAAGLPMLEPADSQEAYDFTLAAFEMSERWGIPVLLRMTTRVCHSKTVVRPGAASGPVRAPHFERDIRGLVMVPAYARPAHRRLRTKLAEIAAWNESSDMNVILDGDAARGIIASGIAAMHAREADPDARMLKLGCTHPLPMGRIRDFAASVRSCTVIEEGDSWLADAIRAAGIAVKAKAEEYRFGELTVNRVRRILKGEPDAEAALPRGNPPQFCPGCPHRTVFEVLSRLKCIVAGDIGCYTLGALPPFEAMDTCLCMGASITVGLGMRKVLPDGEARRVVSVIGDSTFMHSGITGLLEMVYNPPENGHVVLILDNNTTAMTGLQEHPGTGRTLSGQPAAAVLPENLAKSMGIERVFVTDAVADASGFERLLLESLSCSKPSVIIVRRPCLLSARKRKAAGQSPAGGEGSR